MGTRASHILDIVVTEFRYIFADGEDSVKTDRRRCKHVINILIYDTIRYDTIEEFNMGLKS